MVEKFHAFKLKKIAGYLVLGFSDDLRKIVVLKEGVSKVPQSASSAEKSKTRRVETILQSFRSSSDKKWAEMVEALPDDDVRYAITDIFYDTSEGSREEICFIAW